MLAKTKIICEDSRRKLLENAARYERASFLEGDPSSFMHRVEGPLNQEAMAFIASSLSFGSRKQFMAKLEKILSFAGSEVDRWVRKGEFEKFFPLDCEECFYRFYKVRDFGRFLSRYRELLDEYGSLGQYVMREAAGDGVRAVEAIVKYFAANGATKVIPKAPKSACKRLCMFLRWMARPDSPVDLGLWSDFIDPRSLAMPLDTHVLRQSKNLALLEENASPSLSTAKKLSEVLSEVFPEDPLRGDFALFGFGVESSAAAARPMDARGDNLV